MHEHKMNFNVNGVLNDPERQWNTIKKNAMGKSRVAFRKLDVDWKKYNTSDYLFTHDTACCSVETEENGYWITPPCWELVNANGNAWTTPVLLASFKTFIGGDNFLEHCFVKGTKVLMADGTEKCIEDIHEGDMVVNAEGKADRVIGVDKHETDDLVEIHDGIMTTTCTPEHPFLTEEGYVKAIDLNGRGIVKHDGGMSNDYTVSAVKRHDVVYNLCIDESETYIANGYKVHNCQIPALSKGKILDAIARPVVHHSEKYGDANIYIIDCLVATNRKHANLIERIESGKLNTLSMGCGKEDCKIDLPDGTIMNIRDIAVGMDVLTHLGRIRKVTKTFEFDVIDVPLYKVYTDGCVIPLELTGEHPVLISGADGDKFVPISEISEGMKMVHPNGNGGFSYPAITRIEKEYFTGKVYNFSVDEDNSYLVNGLAVHNCLAEYTQCSICGKIIGDNDKNCEHIDRHIGQMCTCQDGKERVCAELCGCMDENGNYVDGSNAFIEISWVDHPAFQGAVVNEFVETNEIKAARENDRNDLAKLFEGNLFERLKVADTDSKIALKIAKEVGRIDRISGNIMDKI